MAGDVSQLLPPGPPVPETPFSGDYDVRWSVYIRCSNRRKLREVHIPALDRAIKEPHGPRTWIYEREEPIEPAERNPNEHRIVALEKISGPYRDSLLSDLMRRLYNLAPNWNITARLDEDDPRGIYLMARHVKQDPGNKTPAVVDVLVELEPDWASIDPSVGRCLGSGQPIRIAK